MFLNFLLNILVVWGIIGALIYFADRVQGPPSTLSALDFGPFIWIILLIKEKGDIMFKKSSIDQAIKQKDKIEGLEKKILKMKEDCDKLKSKAKEDLKWIMEE